ncbi:unnamed protein product [Microthlaspi erraticum]|uniref:Transposase-associated domain-containing protein n=1 Tax=Microthlaspi erraticum TaxID=1685480 RepID=A0A6D2HNK4_9BRAS|nr:unnamed protein product [Microthlaspi erraticum]
MYVLLELELWSFGYNMDKAWVWLPRASLEYVQGATDFVSLSTRRLGNPAEMFCPCDQCRNVCYQLRDTIVEHLVINGMDHKYKRSSCWTKHGDIRNDSSENVPISEREAYELLRTAFFCGEGNPQSANDSGGEYKDSDTIEETAFRKKLKDA